MAVFAYVSPGTSVGYVNDFANIINTSTRTDLEAKLQKLDSDKGIQVAVVTVKTIGDETVESYASRLFSEWGIGRKSTDSGILLLIALDEKKIKIETGYGVEHILTDLQSGRIIREYIAPEFKAGNFSGGIQKGTDEILNILSTSDFNSGSNNNDTTLAGFVELLLKFGILFIIVINVLIRVFAKTKSWWLGGVIGFIGSFFISIIFFSIIKSLVVAFGFGILGLIADYYFSKHPPKGGGRSGGFYMGSSSFHSGGFGGFGGGRSGGGGASGGW